MLKFRGLTGKRISQCWTQWLCLTLLRHSGPELVIEAAQETHGSGLHPRAASQPCA
jgi:hypothetical protein